MPKSYFAHLQIPGTNQYAYSMYRSYEDQRIPKWSTGQWFQTAGDGSQGNYSYHSTTFVMGRPFFQAVYTVRSTRHVYKKVVLKLEPSKKPGWSY